MASPSVRSLLAAARRIRFLQPSTGHHGKYRAAVLTDHQGLTLASRYHSHFSSQYGNGVLGPIVINGPASANYDIDLGPLMISDWYYGGVDAILHRVNTRPTPISRASQAHLRQVITSSSME